MGVKCYACYPSDKYTHKWNYSKGSGGVTDLVPAVSVLLAAYLPSASVRRLRAVDAILLLLV